MLQNELFNASLKDSLTGYWILHTDPIKEVWSPGFYENLGYAENEILASLDYFLSELISNEDLDLFRDNFFNFRRNAVDFKQHIKNKK